MSLAAVMTHLREVRPFGIDPDVQPGATGNGFSAVTRGPAYHAGRSAWHPAWGADVMMASSGGSIPMVSAVAGALPGTEALLAGATDGYANIHGRDHRVLLNELEHRLSPRPTSMNNLPLVKGLPAESTDTVMHAGERAAEPRQS